MNDMMQQGLTTFLDIENNEQCHYLWPTPVVMAKPFNDKFLNQLKKDVKPLLVKGAPATFNQTDIWDLPDLPDTMLEVRDKMLELTDKYYRPMSEMPLPPFRAWKGYFRRVTPDSPYRITPHKHGNSWAVGLYYINTVEENPGNLVMIDPRGGVNWTNQFTAFKKIKVEEGMMLIHPGYLVHFVEPSDPSRGMYYGDRLAIVSNIHRSQHEFMQTLAKNEDRVKSMGSMDL